MDFFMDDRPKCGKISNILGIQDFRNLVGFFACYDFLGELVNSLRGFKSQLGMAKVIHWVSEQFNTIPSKDL